MTPSSKPAAPGLRMALDYGPLIVFFAVNFLAPGTALVRLVTATVAFVVATAAALVISFVKTKTVSPMLLLTGVLVIVFGGLTIYFHDPRFIQMKPTIIYGLLAALLGFGLVTGRPLLQGMLGSAYPGLNAEGWRKLTFNFMLFFVFMAVLNEIVRHRFSQDFWVAFKLWGALPLTVLFSLANLPMLMRHGLNTDGPAADDIPPQG